MFHMSILERLGFTRSTRDILAGSYHLPISGVYQKAVELPPFLAEDIFDEETRAKLPLTRSTAISVPAISKARNLLVGTIAKFPLKAYRAGVELTDQPTFLYRTNSTVSPYERMAWTVDDLIFHGYSLWLVERGQRTDPDAARPIVNAEWIPTDRWTISDGVVLVDDVDIPDENVIVFNSPFEGLLNIAGRTIRGARDTESSWTGRAKNPVPIIELHMLDDQLTDEEARAVVDAWATARTQPNGAVGYTPANIEVRTHGEVKADLMVEGRNAVRTDIGSFLNIRASMLDGTMGVDSLTYTTTEGERNSFYEFDLPFWTDPITSRLSLDDVLPRGQYVEFQKYTDPNPAAPAKED